jgi:hypothetical protein
MVVNSKYFLRQKMVFWIALGCTSWGLPALAEEPSGNPKLIVTPAATPALSPLQEAEQLSWAGRYREAIQAYDRILSTTPTDQSAQLGRAEVLSWDGQYGAAIDAYNAVLKLDPNLEKALLGKAQVTLWQGDPVRALGQFLSLRQRFPESKPIQLGLAKVYYAMQDAKSAYGILQPLLQAQDQAAIDLLKKMRSPQSTTAFEYRRRSSQQSRFTVSQGVTVKSAEAVPLGSVEVGYERFTQPGFEALQNYRVGVGIEGGQYPVHWHLAVGGDMFDRLSARAFVQAQVQAQVNPRFQVGVVANYQAFKENVPTLENQINLFRVRPYVFWQIQRTTSLYAQYEAGFYSDGNRDGQIWLGLKQTLGTFYLEGSVFNWTYRKDPNNGYFAPSDYFAYGAEAGWQGKVVDRLHCRVGISLGRQYYGGETRPDNGYKAGCSADLSKRFGIDAQYRYTSSGLSSGGGNDSNEKRFQVNLKTRL